MADPQQPHQQELLEQPEQPRQQQQERQSITCHCKAVRITFPPLREPAFECRCSVCRRYGALWAYYKPDEVHVEGETEGYQWGKKTMSFHRCKQCGCVTHYSALRDTEPEPRMVVNCRLLGKAEYDKLETEHSDGEGDEW